MLGRRHREPDVLPWWHPWVLARELWNVAFSAALGLGLGALAYDVLAQASAAVLPGDRADYEPGARLAGILFGLFVAYVSFMAGRMDDKGE